MKRIAVLAGLMFTLQAAWAQTVYTFTFSDLHATVWREADPLPTDLGVQSLSGRFAGSDLNGDGHVVADELTSFSFAGLNSETNLESIRFDYDLGRHLLDIHSTGIRAELHTGRWYATWTPSETWRWEWTSETRTTVAVPEPSSGVSLFAGLGLLALSAEVRRRRRPTNPTMIIKKRHVPRERA